MVLCFKLPWWRFLSGAPLQTDEESSLHEEEESLLVEGERLHRGQGNYLGKWERLRSSVADPDPGSGAFLTPGSEIRNRFFPDPGSQTNIFESLVTIFWVKFFENWPKFFSSGLKTKIIFNFVKFWLHKKVWQQIFFTPLFSSVVEPEPKEP